MSKMAPRQPKDTKGGSGTKKDSRIIYIYIYTYIQTYFRKLLPTLKSRHLTIRLTGIRGFPESISHKKHKH